MYSTSQIKNTGHATVNLYLRCTACCTCAQCGKDCNPDQFAEQGKTCRRCRNLEEEHKCVVCKATSSASSFPANALANARKHGAVLICLPCVDHGFSTRDIVSYRCIHGCTLGHRSFDSQLLRDHKRPDRTGILTCTTCQVREREIESKMKSRWKTSRTSGQMSAQRHNVRRKTLARQEQACVRRRLDLCSGCF